MNRTGRLQTAATTATMLLEQPKTMNRSHEICTRTTAWSRPFQVTRLTFDHPRTARPSLPIPDIQWTMFLLPVRNPPVAESAALVATCDPDFAIAFDFARFSFADKLPYVGRFATLQDGFSHELLHQIDVQLLLRKSLLRPICLLRRYRMAC